jgi:hypothetical protein
MTEQSYERLCPRVNPPPLLSKCQRRAVVQEGTWREFTQLAMELDGGGAGFAQP